MARGGVRLQSRAVEDEIRGEMERDALLLKSRAKLEGHGPADPLNS